MMDYALFDSLPLKTKPLYLRVLGIKMMLFILFYLIMIVLLLLMVVLDSPKALVIVVIVLYFIVSLVMEVSITKKIRELFGGIKK